jgi:two-component system, sensor histidine kinase and response regulator
VTLLVLDTEAALQRLDGDLELLRELAAMFRDQAPRALAQMRVSAERDDRETLYRDAHSMKGSAGNIGAVAVAEVARQLELAVGERGVSGAAELLDVLESELARLDAALGGWLA